MAYKALEGSLLYSPKRSYLAVVAIDLGTTYSGFAFSFIKDKGKDAVFMNRDWANEQGAQTSKTPTCLLLKSDLEFDSFGYEAIEKYSSLQDKREENEYLFFKHFKMALHNDETLNSRTPIKAANGRSVQAKRVFARSINFLKDEAVKVIRQRTGDDHFNADDIQWVLTVPAIWTPRAKQFMREAAYEAGVGSAEKADQLMIALEPEAAAIFCKEKNLNDFQEEAGDRCLDGVLSQINTHYIVVDIGGGTLDVTVHEFQDDGKIKEIYKVTGGPYGGMKKRGKRILDSSLMTNIRLPRSFVSQIIQSREARIDRYGEREVKIKSNEYLSLSSAMMRKLFAPVVESIKEHLNNLLRKPQLSKVQTMLLVGGFAESVFLQEEIKKTFSGRCRILVPHHASVAVAQGAVIFGKKPTTITERVISTTYGIRCVLSFIAGVHPEEKKKLIDGTEWCKDVFDRIVKENKVIKLGQRIKKIYHPPTPNTTSVLIAFHVSTDPETKFVTDPGVTQIGNISIQTPVTSKGTDRDIEVSMYFGGTEITATACDVSSGNKAQTTLDFFCQ
ncbi:Heat shock 70 kDa protein 12A [Stylophora pistillata]|uniref:Heat shock 70 kDa protein 12A n=1 Tax=Stylophora pistillata TaxID=50429 RepID=A0A2B4RQ43_STYPI|nr:Heat shock 70 kDa protein 12A [Stylophora pistillata]